MTTSCPSPAENREAQAEHRCSEHRARSSSAPAPLAGAEGVEARLPLLPPQESWQTVQQASSSRPNASPLPGAASWSSHDPKLPGAGRRPAPSARRPAGRRAAPSARRPAPPTQPSSWAAVEEPARQRPLSFSNQARAPSCWNWKPGPQTPSPLAFSTSPRWRCQQQLQLASPCVEPCLRCLQW